MKRRTFFLLMAFCCLSVFHTKTQAQVHLMDSVPRKGISLELQGSYIDPKAIPFWMRSNQYGSIPLAGGSGSMIARAYQNYKVEGEWNGKAANGGTNWDWGYGIEGRANIGKEFRGQLIDAHIKARFAMFEARLGRSKDVMGLNGDTLLTSGNFSVSGNALGIPEFEISIPEYYRLPWFGGLFSVKGNFANGYIGNVPVISRLPLDNGAKTYLHQKSLYGRLGRINSKLQFYGGINHQVQWGSEQKMFGSQSFELNSLETFYYVFSGMAYGGEKIPRSKIGNHQGSVDVAASYDFNNISVMVYRQNIYDVGALGRLANLRDGLNGITLKNKKFNNINKPFDWQTLLFEFFYSKDQAGYPWSKRTKSGDEDYYNNSQYLEGWSYKGLGLGTPLIVTKSTARNDQAHYPNDFFISNRVISAHLGAKGRIYNWTTFAKLTYSKHYGTFATSEFGKSTGNTFHTPHAELFTPIDQFSFIIQTEKSFDNGFNLGITIANDSRGLLDRSFGTQISVRKTFGY